MRKRVFVYCGGVAVGSRICLCLSKMHHFRDLFTSDWLTDWLTGENTMYSSPVGFIPDRRFNQYCCPPFDPLSTVWEALDSPERHRSLFCEPWSFPKFLKFVFVQEESCCWRSLLNLYIYMLKKREGGGGSLTNKDLTMHRKSVKNMQIQMRNNLH